RREGGNWTVTMAAPGVLRFRYKLEMHRRVPDGSTGSGLDSQRLYAVTRSLFVAPDPTAYKKTNRTWPVTLVQVIPPTGWRAFAGWTKRGDTWTPADGDDLLGATLAAAPDFRFYD